MLDPRVLSNFCRDLEVFCKENLDLKNLKTQIKSDLTPVTIIDQKISDFCKTHTMNKNYNFYSEEDHSVLNFPVLVVDPIDGTKELIKARPECVVSLAWMDDENCGEAAIYNPLTGFLMTSHQVPALLPLFNTQNLMGLVSRTEWDLGFYEESDFMISPRGSIAFKLALLSSGAADFVVSLKPKNIWDIAAGTILCKQRGLEFWSNGSKVKSLNQKLYNPPLIWGASSSMKILNESFSGLMDKVQSTDKDHT
jgi:myo-inositol-1(or 4)-monophosphatase